jgi:beta-lactamase class A
VDDRIERIWANATRGLSAAWEIRLGREILASRDRDRSFSGASMIKTLLAALIDEDVRGGLVQLSRPVQVTRQSLVGDDGLLRFGQIPTMHRLADLILLMVSVSDNTATNTLIEFLGGPGPINTRFAGRGWSSRLNGVIGAPGDEAFSAVSIADHQAALASLTQPLIIAAFAAQQDRRSLARLVDYDAEFRHKTGTVDTVRHDAGVIVTSRGFLWAACFTEGGPVAEWVDHPACMAMGRAMRETLLALDLSELVVS